MPVQGNHFDRRAARHFSRGPELYVEQRQNSAQQVNAVRAGENVKEAAAGICGQENPLCGELVPSDDLAYDEKDAENRAVAHQWRNPSSSFALKRPCARASVKLLAISTKVLSHRMRGTCSGIQALLGMSLRTMYALTNAMKNIKMPASAMNMPVM